MPVWSRCDNAISAPIAAYIPPTLADWSPEPRIGGMEWSSYPQFQIGPAPASMVRSETGWAARGLSRPKGVTETQINPG